MRDLGYSGLVGVRAAVGNYMSFRVDATPHIHFGERNVIAVEVDTRKHQSRWYPGAGIYRKVTMTVSLAFLAPDPRLAAADALEAISRESAEGAQRIRRSLIIHQRRKVE